MYSKSGKVISSKQSLSNYIDGYDLYNSKLILQLTDPNLPREDYVISNLEYRPDLIAEEVYGSSRYLGLLLLTQAIGLESYTKGTVLRIIPKVVLDRLIESI